MVGRNVRLQCADYIVQMLKRSFASSLITVDLSMSFGIVVFPMPYNLVPICPRIVLPWRRVDTIEDTTISTDRDEARQGRISRSRSEILVSTLIYSKSNTAIILCGRKHPEMRLVQAEFRWKVQDEHRETVWDSAFDQGGNFDRGAYNVAQVGQARTCANNLVENCI